MKKAILAMAVILVVGLTSAFASSSEEINQRAVASFNSEFVNAKNVSWQNEKRFVKVTFTLMNQVMFGYYSNETGQLLAVVRNILSDQLPINLLTNLKNNYGDHWVSSLFEVAKEDHTSYYTTIESADETLVLQSNGSNEWSVFKRTKKA
ncbi:MAG: hypothetical protein ACHQET_13015 [Chitinophagales bacterium]